MDIKSREGISNDIPEHGYWLNSIFILALVLAAITRILFAAVSEHPGHGDSAYYLTLAQNIADGRGLVIDYIWNFLHHYPNLTHPAGDYWMPLTSIIISPFILLFAKSLFASLLPSIIFGLILSLITYRIAAFYFESRSVACWSAIFILFVPALFNFSLLTDSTIYYALFVALGLYLMARGISRPRYLLLSAVCAGLAQMTRQDGVLLILTLIFLVVIAKYSWRRKILYLATSIVVYIVILIPLFAINLHYYGILLITGSAKTIYLTNYEDLYSYSKHLTLDNYLAWGIKNIIYSKLNMLLHNIKTTLAISGWFILPLIGLGVIGMVSRLFKKNNWMILLPPTLFYIILLFFHSFVATSISVYGSFQRSVMALVPFFIIFAVGVLHRIIKQKKYLNPILASIAIILIILCYDSASDMISNNDRLGRILNRVKTAIELSHHSPDEVVVMTRAPWEMYYSTGYRCLQIPNDDIDIIYDVAKEYKANYLLLPAPRQALKSIYDGSAVDPRFVHLINIPGSDYKLYGIE
jgi:4-amino-4-deoxy-L-arabinose transferase-like glycosyltransferase